MSGIFVNYRKGAHTGVVEALHRELARHFGEDQVFLDMRSMLPGERYPDELRWGVLSCEVLLVVVHADWLAAVDEHGTRLLDRERDWVREEIEIALEAGKPVVPVRLGDARPPAQQDLPPSIRDLALRQAHRIRTGSFGPDVERLASRLEQHVAPTWVPPPLPAPRVRRRPGRWLAWVTAVLATALIFGPAIRWIVVSDPSNPLPLADAVGTSGWMTLMMAAPLLAYGVILALLYPFRDRIDSHDRDIQTMPAARFNTFTMPLAVLWLLFGTAVFVLLYKDHWRVALPVALFLDVVGFAVLGSRWARAEQREEEDRASWPQPLPSLADKVPELRFAVAQLRIRVAEWRSPLSREQRDKSWWSLAILSDAADGLHTRARQPRLRGLMADHPWWTTAYAIWAALAMGIVGEAMVPMIYWRTATFREYVVAVAFVLVVGVVTMGNVEVEYRWRRWTRLRPATEIQKDIAELSGRVLLDGLKRVPWQHVRDAHGPAAEVPRLLRLVSGGDPAAQQAAVGELCDRLLHRDAVAEATVHAVPFLANLSTGRHLAAPTGSRLAVLLARIAVAHRYVPDGGAEPVSIGCGVTDSAEPVPEWNLVRQARAAVDAAAPRLFERLRADREHDVPSLLALAAAAPSVATPQVVAELERLAKQDHSTVGAAAVIVLAVVRDETVPPAQLLAAADGNASVIDVVQQSLGCDPPPVAARKTVIELAALR